MKRIFLSLIILFSFVGLEASPHLPKLSSADKRSALKSRRAALTSKGTFKRLERAHNSLSKEDFATAVSILKKLLITTKARKFENAQVQQNLGYAYAQKGEHKKAIKHLKDALALNALPESPTLSTMYTLAQLYVSSKQLALGKQTINEWFGYVEKPSPQAHILLASILAQEEKKEAALANVERAISLSTNPQESWLQFAVALNYELKNYKKVSEYLEYLVALNPQKKEYWTQLSGTYLTLNNLKLSLTTLELAKKWGHLIKEQELLNLVSLYLMRGIPFHAARMMSGYMDAGKIKPSKRSLEILAQSWLQAEELDKALKPLEMAAKLSKDGKTFASLGQLYLEKEEWGKATQVLEQALKKGSLHKPEDVHLALGIAYYHLNNGPKALTFFEKAKSGKRTERAAEQWLSHINAS